VFVQSSIFTYTSAAGNNYLRQHFELDGVQLSGPGGLWILDVPLETYVTPEPASIGALLIGMVAVLRRRRSRR
jgi:hypothetical protein